MPVFNVNETLVRQLLEDDFVKTGRLVCACQRCQDDIVALALNGLPTRYAVSAAGEAYYKSDFLSSQLQSDVLRELTLAVATVGDYPHHNPASPQLSKSGAERGES